MQYLLSMHVENSRSPCLSESRTWQNVKDRRDKKNDSAYGTGERMHNVHTPGEKLRICLDPRNLNNAILQGHFKLNMREEVMARMLRAKIFSKLGGSKGFWQLQLDEKSSG